MTYFYFKFKEERKRINNDETSDMIIMNMIF